MEAASAWAVPRGAEGVRILVEAGTARGMTTADCLAGTGLTEADLQDENTVLWAHQEFDVIRNLIARLGDAPGAGIDVGTHSTVGRAGVVGFLILASPTVRDAFDLALPYQALWPTHLQLSVVEDDEFAYVVADDSALPADIKAFIVGRDLAGIAIALRGARIPLAPLWIDTTLDAEHAATLAELWRLAPHDVHPDQPQNRFAGPRELPDLPMPHADLATARVFERQCRELVEHRLSRVGVSGQVRSRLLHTRGEMPSMQAVADELHMDPRTLRRRLGAEGTSFRSLLDTVRHQRALDLLGGDLSIEEIAAQLGYAETANFTHAFTRWEGIAPSYFRSSRSTARL